MEKNTSKESGIDKSSLLQKRPKLRWLGIAGVIILAAGAIFLIFSSGKDQAPGISATIDSPSLGFETAKITIVEYGDFGCTTCKAWYLAGIKEQVLIEYIDDVRFVWKDFPVITSYSPKAAEAGKCAHEQGRFWEYHNLLYSYAPRLAVNDLKTYASEMGLDAEQFNDCLDSGKYKAAVEADLNEAIERGFRGTPSFLINDRVLIGPPSFNVLKQQIEQILSGEETSQYSRAMIP
jgi:protein-disulfide isomerase